MKLKFELASKARKDQRIIQYEFDERLLKARLNDIHFIKTELINFLSLFVALSLLGAMHYLAGSQFLKLTELNSVH